MVFEQYIPESELVSSYSLERDLLGNIEKFELSLGLTILRRKNLIERRTEENYQGDEFSGYAVTEAGQAWVEANQDRVRLVIAEARAPDQDSGNRLADDIPF